MPYSSASLVEFTQSLYSVKEIIAGQPAQIGLTLKRTGNLNRFDEVQLSPVENGSGFWNDFALHDQYVQFNPGETSRTIVIDINPDGEMEGTEAIAFELIGMAGTEVGPQSTTTLEIIDSDVAYIEFAQAIYTVTEADMDGASYPHPQQLQVVLTRSGALERHANVKVEIAGGSAQLYNDYSSTQGFPAEVRFEPWERTKVVTLDVLPDWEFEGTETIELVLSDGGGPATDVQIGAQSTTTVNILDSEAAYVDFAQAEYRTSEANINQIEVTLTRSGQLDRDVFVNVDLAASTATLEADFATRTPYYFGNITFPFPVNFAPGETSQTFTVDVFPDGEAEGLETIAFELSAFPYDEVAIGPQGTTTITILDDDMPSVEFAKTAYTVQEGDAFNYIELTLTRTGALNETAEVNLFVQGGSAIPEHDYYLQNLTFEPIVFYPGQTSQTVYFDVVGDDLAELTETAILGLTGVGNTIVGPNQTTTVAIEDDDIATVEFGQLSYWADEVTLGQAGQAVLTVTRSGNLNDSDTVELIATGDSAQEGGDFTFDRFIHFQPGETGQSVLIDLERDNDFEGTEFVNFQLVSPDNTTITDANVATLNIRDEQSAYIEFAQAVFTTTEDPFASEPQQLQVTLTRSGAIDVPTTIDLELNGGTAEKGQDFRFSGGSNITPVFFESWERTKTVTLDIFADSQFEGLETIELKLNSTYSDSQLGAQSTATVNILDAEVALVEFAQTHYRLNEDGNEQLFVTLNRSGQLDYPTDVEIQLTSGTASVYEDFDLYNLPQSVRFESQETTKEVALDVFVYPDGQPEGLETINLELTAPYSYSDTVIGTERMATVTIVDEDVPSVEFAQTAYTLQEGDAFNYIELILTRTGALNETAEVNLFAQGGSAILGNDYYLTSTFEPIIFYPGQTSQIVYFDVFGDDVAELTETAVLGLTGVGNTTVGPNQTTIVAIEDDDVAIVEFSQTDYSVNETDGQMLLTLTRSGNLNGFAEVELVANSNSTAQEGFDFFFPGQIISFQPGEATQSVVVELLSDTLNEGTELAVFELFSRGATLIGNQHTANLVIIDPGTSGADTFVGSETDDIIKGQGGNDNIQGLGGNDRLEGNSGDDVIDGGEGDDLIKGHKGNDLIEGGEGNDILNGGIGFDQLRGGLGDDVYMVDNLDDVVVESVNSGIDRVNASVSWELGQHVENLTLHGTALINGTGNSLNNILKGNKSANLLQGLAGSDTLKGQNGDDTLIGVDQTNLAPGLAEIDTLSGGKNADLFVLGDVQSVFYDDGQSSSQGLGDYAMITDFKTSQQDRIQLKGSPEAYRVSTSPLGTGGKAIYHRVAGEADELIAVVKGSSNLNLTSNSFSYV